MKVFPQGMPLAETALGKTTFRAENESELVLVKRERRSRELRSCRAKGQGAAQSTG